MIMAELCQPFIVMHVFCVTSDNYVSCKKQAKSQPRVGHPWPSHCISIVLTLNKLPDILGYQAEARR